MPGKEAYCGSLALFHGVNGLVLDASPETWGLGHKQIAKATHEGATLNPMGVCTTRDPPRKCGSCNLGDLKRVGVQVCCLGVGPGASDAGDKEAAMVSVELGRHLTPTLSTLKCGCQGIKHPNLDSLTHLHLYLVSLGKNS